MLLWEVVCLFVGSLHPNPYASRVLLQALRAFELKVCLDLWVLSDTHVDLASLRFLATTTSGQIHRYSQAAFARVPAAMQTFAQRPHAFHCLARLRVSHEVSSNT